MFTDHFRELEALRQQIAHLATGAFRRELSENVSRAARHEADVGFERAVDPYDTPWPQLTYRDGKALDDEGHLRRVITGPATVFENGFIISTRGGRTFDSVKYAATHQYGAHIRARGPRGMRFRVGGTTRTNGPMTVRASEVVVPRRQFMPEGRLGARWERGMARAANDTMAQNVAPRRGCHSHRRAP